MGFSSLPPGEASFLRQKLHERKSQQKTISLQLIKSALRTEYNLPCQLQDQEIGSEIYPYTISNIL